MINVIFIVAAPFTPRDYQRYGMDVFLRRKLNIAVWDVTFAVYPHLRRQLRVGEAVKWERLTVFDRITDAVDAVDRLQGTTVAISTIPLSLGSMPLLRRFSRKQIPYIVTAVANILPIERHVSWNARLVRAAKILNPRATASYLLRRLPAAWLGIRAAAFIIAEAGKTVITRPEVTGRTRVIRTHALDYDQFLNDPQPPAVEPIAVFLDNFLPFHSDGLYSGEKPPVSPERYYPSLRRYFDHIEAQLGLRVVVAAHPRSKYENMDDVFGGRLVAKGATFDLVRRATLVIAHFSTAIGFAVTLRKPIRFITTEELEDDRRTSYNYRKYIADVAASLGETPVNIDRGLKPELPRQLAVNTSKYAQYFSDYIKVPDSEPLPFWEIVCNRIEEYFAQAAPAQT